MTAHRRAVPRTPSPAAPAPVRRRALTLVLAGAALLAACGSSPPLQLYRLPSAPPLPPPAAPQAAEVWQLLLPVRIPDYLDRQALLLPQGESGLLALSDQRWAESLREAVPRVLREDLALLRGEDRVWTAPVPAGVVVARRLRVELLALDVGTDRRSVHLQARWTLVDPQGQKPPLAETASLDAPAAGTRVDELVAAHRLALWRLAERIAASR